jgi:hypothetical protein
MLAKLAMARLGKLAVLLVLFGVALVLENCSSTTSDDDAARRAPATYGIGGPAW